jgi:hypothetical protein
VSVGNYKDVAVRCIASVRNSSTDVFVMITFKEVFKRNAKKQASVRNASADESCRKRVFAMLQCGCGCVGEKASNCVYLRAAYKEDCLRRTVQGQLLL